MSNQKIFQFIVTLGTTIPASQQRVFTVAGDDPELAHKEVRKLMVNELPATASFNITTTEAQDYHQFGVNLGYNVGTVPAKQMVEAETSKVPLEMKTVTDFINEVKLLSEQFVTDEVEKKKFNTLIKKLEKQYVK